MSFEKSWIHNAFESFMSVLEYLWCLSTCSPLTGQQTEITLLSHSTSLVLQVLQISSFHSIVFKHKIFTAERVFVVKTVSGVASWL